jgi:transposase InsO family protein
MGLSRASAHRWLTRFDAEGWAGLHDRSSRPRSCPRRTPAAVEARVLAARDELRAGRDRIADVTGVPARTVSKILARHGRPAIACLDPMTGVVIRASRITTVRYERPAPGDLIHIDIKKIGRIPDGGGWRSLGRATTATERSRRQRAGGVGYDHVHAAIDDHSRLAYAEVLPEDTGAVSAEFLLRAADFFAGHGITIREVITDNALAYRRSTAFRDAVASLGARQLFTRPRSPWQNGKVERFNRTLATEWAYRQPFTSSQQRTEALAPWLEHYNTERNHHGIGGKPPITRAPSTT